MGRDSRGRNLGTGIYQRKDGRYEARAKVNGQTINLFDRNLKSLKKRFEEAKLEAEDHLEARRQKITLNEWFEEWFENYKMPYIKETSEYSRAVKPPIR